MTDQNTVTDGYTTLILKMTTGIYEKSPLCFRPLEPKLEAGLNIVWKKYQIFSKASLTFLQELQKHLILNKKS